MVRQNQMCGVANEQVAIDPDSEISQADDLIDQSNRIDHDPVADHTDFVPAQNA